ncbi:MAG: formylglycine-generating enzyme family protein [Polyangiaceae bacterium]|nr:formylglycine-generating enzyme family protein [Polyangiaceae bacterium]
MLPTTGRADLLRIAAGVAALEAAFGAERARELLRLGDGSESDAALRVGFQAEDPGLCRGLGGRGGKADPRDDPPAEPAGRSPGSSPLPAAATEPAAPARLLRVAAASSVSADERVVPSVDVAPWERPARGRELAFPEAEPLVAWPVLWRRLRPALCRCAPSRQVDGEALARHLAGATPIDRVPTLVVRRLAPRLRLVIDRSRRLLPFWRDQARLRRALARWTPRSRLPPVFVGDGQEPLEVLQARSRTGAMLDDAGFRDVTILALGDVGVYGDHRIRAEWVQAAEWLRARGAELHALCPCPAWRIDPGIARLWGAECWDARERRTTFLAPVERQSRVEALLALLAPANRIELGLARAARCLLPADGTDSGTEADLVGHPGVVGHSFVALTLDPDTLGRLRAAFDALEPATQRAAIDLIRCWHEGLPEEVLASELFELWARGTGTLTDVEEAQVLDFMAPVARALDAVDASNALGRDLPIGVRTWFKELARRLPESAWTELPGGLGPLLQRAWVVVHRDEPAASAPPGIAAEALCEAAGRSPLTPRSYSVWQRGTDLVILPTERSEPLRSSGSRVGQIIAATPRVYLAEPGRPNLPYSLLSDPSTAIPLPALRSASCVTLTTDRGSLTLDLMERPSWATRLGRDRYGLYAELEVGCVTHRLRYLPPGRFLMGSPESEPERVDWERQHWVTLTRGFWLGETAVPQAFWEAVMGNNPSHFEGEDLPEAQRGQLPVERVSWEDCQQFCARLRQAHPGFGARLPTEAEWEYACRAGTATPFHLGESITPEQVNYNGNYPYAGGAKGQYREKTVPVDCAPFLPNAWGLKQMHGNVWEWCEDWLGDYGAEEQRDPTGPAQGRGRVLRGGSWYDPARRCRSAYRHRVRPDVRGHVGGFRLAAVQPALEPVEPAGSRDGAARAAGTAARQAASRRQSSQEKQR